MFALLKHNLILQMFLLALVACGIFALYYYTCPYTGNQSSKYQNLQYSQTKTSVREG